MDPHDKKLLKILNALHPVNDASQRDLASTLNLSLGTINASLKWMLVHAFIRKQNVNGNRIRYQLTQTGLQERRRLILLDWGRLLDGYADIRSKIDAILRSPRMHGAEKVAFLGVGRLAEIAYFSLLGTDIQLTAVIDDNEAGGRFLHHPIKPLSDLPATPCDRILLTGLDYYLTKGLLDKDNLGASLKENMVRFDA